MCYVYLCRYMKLSCRYAGDF